MKLRSVLLGGLLAAGLIGSVAPAHAAPTHKEGYDCLVNLRFKEKTLLPPVALPNIYSAYVFDFDHKLRPFTGNQLSRAINGVDMAFQSSPFNVDVVPTQAQARALEQLGLLSHMGHFAIINAGNPNVKAGAVAIVNQLAEVSDHFKMGWLRSQYQRLATDIGDAGFKGGAGAVAARYDATVASLYDQVAASYGIDGHWHFMLGGAMAGLYATSAGGDHYHSEYFLVALDNLYHAVPATKLEGAAKVSHFRVFAGKPCDSDRLAAESFAFIQQLTQGRTSSLNPHWCYKPLPEWNRHSMWPLEY